MAAVKVERNQLWGGSEFIRNSEVGHVPLDVRID